ncbi:MAG: hypothetical protein ACREV5_20720 [Steroidobacter sp.]
MPLELDHIFVACAPNAPEGDALAQFGLVEGSRNTHPGQGTANRRYFFSNFMLELLWVANGDEATANAQNRRTRLYERWLGRNSGACPFGVVFRRAGDSPSPAPFRTWSYHPSYLPEHLSIEIADGTTLEEPELLYLPFVRSTGPRAGEPIDHLVPIRHIHGISIGVPSDARLSEASKSAQRCGLLTYFESDSHILEIRFTALRESLFDLRPTLPLLFRGVV